MMESESEILRIVEAGASGYLLKRANKEELIHPIRTVAAGHIYLLAEIALQLLKEKIRLQQI